MQASKRVGMNGNVTERNVQVKASGCGKVTGG